METFRIVIKIMCAVLSIVNLVIMTKSAYDGNTNEIITKGVWAIVMILLYKL